MELKRKRYKTKKVEEEVNKINWKQKLASRKFWVAVTGFVTAIMVALKIDELTIEQTISVISATSILIAYIIGEGMVDAARTNKEEDNE